jgi:hypothetical protein
MIDPAEIEDSLKHSTVPGVRHVIIHELQAVSMR